MTLAQMQARFFELKGKLAVGQLTDQEFKHELEKLRFQDPHGRWWMIGAQSGRWYYYDGARWLLGDPPDPGAPGLDAGASVPGIPATTPRPAYSQPQTTIAADHVTDSAQTISVPYSYAPAQSNPQSQTPAPLAASAYAASQSAPQPPVRTPTPPHEPGKTAPRNGSGTRYVAPPPLDVIPPAPQSASYSAAAQPPTAPSLAPVAPPIAKQTLGDSIRQDLGKVHLPHVEMPQLQRPNLHTPNLHVPPQFMPHAPASIKKYQPPFILIGAVVIGLAMVALLWLAVDNFLPNKPVSTFFARALGAQPNVRPTRAAAQIPEPNSPQNVDNLVQMGSELSAKSQFEPAIAQYQAAAKESPNDARVYMQWARALALTGRIGEAIAQAEKATRLDPSSANAFAELARAYAWAGRNEQAIEAGKRAVELDSANATAQAFLAEAFLRAGRNAEAQQTVDAALELDDLNPETHRVAGWVSILSGRKDDGVGEWNRVIELAPGIFLYRYEFGLVLANHLNDPERAIPSFQSAIELYPPYIPSYIALGQAYLEANQPGPAVLQFQKALTLDPGSTDAFVGLGRAFANQQKCQQAIPYFQKALELNQALALATQGLEDCGALAKGAAPEIVATPVAIAPLPTAISQATVAPLANDPPPATPAVNPAVAPINAGPGRIYYPVYDGQYRIYSANQDGSDRQLVRELASSPSVSLDGSRLLYYSWQADQRGIHRVNSDGSDDVYLSLRTEDTLPAWSPDGSEYIYSTRAGEGGDINKRAYTLRIANTANKPRNDPNPVVDEAQYPSWGPTGEIVYRDCAFPDDQCGLAITNDDGSNKRIITNINSTAPAWSPDGTRIVFMSNVGGNWDLWTVSAGGGSPARLTDDIGDDGLPIYSPDGSKIAFVSHREGQWAVWTIGLDGENETKLFDIGGEVGGPIAGEPPAMPGQTWLGQRIAWR